jgi:peptide deformylase
MALLPILEYPDPRLRTRAEPVAVFDEKLRTLIDDMFHTMYAAPGIGLAAPQVDVHKRLLIVDVSEEHNERLVFANPQILKRDRVGMMEEGCLSVPGIFDEVERAQHVIVRAQDAHGKVFEREMEGLLAVCVQHEIDHLEGRLFVDYLSELKRERIRRKLQKERRANAEQPKRKTPAGASAL